MGNWVWVTWLLGRRWEILPNRLWAGGRGYLGLGTKGEVATENRATQAMNRWVWVPWLGYPGWWAPEQRFWAPEQHLWAPANCGPEESCGLTERQPWFCQGIMDVLAE